MEMVRFKWVIEGVLRQAGIDPDDASDADILTIIEAIGNRFRAAKEYYRWPVYMTISQRNFIDANTKLIPYETADNTLAYIGAVTGVWDANPSTNPDATALPYRLEKDGIRLPPDTPGTSAWVEFRDRCENFNALIYDPARGYAFDETVYFPGHEGDGMVWRPTRTGVGPTAGQTPENTPSAWELLIFPEFLSRAVKAGAYSDWLASEERPNAAAKWDAKFFELLDEQVWQVTKFQGQTGRPSVSR